MSSEDPAYKRRNVIAAQIQKERQDTRDRINSTSVTFTFRSSTEARTFLSQFYMEGTPPDQDYEWDDEKPGQGGGLKVRAEQALLRVLACIGIGGTD